MPFPADASKVKLGKGSLLLDQLDASGNPTGFNFKGNASAISMSADVTRAQLFGSTTAAAPLIASAPTRTAFSLAVTLNEFTLTNLRQFLLGEANVVQQLLLSNQTVEFSGSEVVQGHYYKTGARRITGVVVTYDGTNVAVLGTDYSVNSEFGIIRLLPGGGIADGADLEIEWDQPALTIDVIRIAKNAAPVCHLLYLADDANVDGDAAHDEIEIWKVNVAPDGELQLISEEYGSFSLSMEILSDAENHPDEPFGVKRRVRS